MWWLQVRDAEGGAEFLESSCSWRGSARASVPKGETRSVALGCQKGALHVGRSNV
jgi:hypothetical protein